MSVSRRTLLAGGTGLAVTASAGPASADPGDAVRPAVLDPVSLGEPLKDVNLIGATVAKTPDGKSVMYGVINGKPAVLAAVDAVAGKALWTRSLPGAGGSYAVVALPDGDLYVAAYSNGTLYRVGWGSTEVEDLGKPLPSESFLWDLTIGPEGFSHLLFGVTYPGARLYSYDPASGAVHDFGALATDTPQARTITAYGTKLYAGTMSPAHLFEIEPADGAKREIPLPPGADPQGSIFDIDAAGDLLYVRMGSDIKHSPLYPYDLAAGTWRDPIPEVAGLSLPAPGPNGEVYVMQENRLQAYDPATGSLTATPLEYPGRVYNYRGAGWLELGDPEWPGLTLTGFFWRGEVWRYNPSTAKSLVEKADLPGAPVEILSLENAADGGVWAGGYLGGFAHVSAKDGASTYHHWSQTESILDDGTSVWLGAYPDARGYRYNPEGAFNDPDYEPGPPGTPVNPVKLWDFSEHQPKRQDRVFALARAGRYTLAATGPKLTSFGGTLAVHDIRTGAVRIVERLAPDRALTSLAVRDGVVFAGTWINGGTGSSSPPQSEGTVLAYDIKAGRVKWQTSPLSGAPSYVGTLFDASGRLWTLAGTSLLRLNPRSGEVLRRIELPGEVDITGMTFPMLAGVVRRSGSFLYVKVAGRLFRVRPATGRFEDLGAFPYRLFTIAADGALLMSSGATLYRWDL